MTAVTHAFLFVVVTLQSGQFQFHEPGGLVTPSSILHYPISTVSLCVVVAVTHAFLFVVVTLQSGQFQFHEPGGLVTPSSMLLYQVNLHGSICTAFDISSTCEVIVFGDSGGESKIIQPERPEGLKARGWGSWEKLGGWGRRVDGGEMREGR